MRIAARAQPFLIVVGACLGMLVFAGQDAYRERARAVQGAKADTANLAVLLEAVLRQHLLRVDAVLEAAMAAMAQTTASEATAQPLAALQARLPRDGLVHSVAWLTAAGELAGWVAAPGAERPGPERLSQSKALADTAPPGQRAIGRLQQDATGAWAAPMAVRLPHGPAGTPGGAVVAWFDPTPLRMVLDSVDRGSNGFATLFTRDGWMLATSPRNDSLLANNWSAAPMFTEHLPKGPTGSVQQVVVRDGTERVYSYRALAEYPVVASIGISMTDALAEWRASLLTKGLLLAAVAAALLVGATALSRTLGRREQAEQALADSSRQIAQSEHFLRTLADSLPLRISYLDTELRYRFVNRGHSERFQRPREAILGRTRVELTGQPLPQPTVEHVQAVLRGEPQRYEFEEDQGQGPRIIETQLVPDLAADGRVLGFYATGADVTERRQQQRRIESALAERETLLRELYHRVKNNLQLIQSLLNLQRRSLPAGAARAALEESVRRVHAMALVHERLYQAGDLSLVDLDDYTRQLLRDIAEGAGAAARGVELVADIEPVRASLVKSVPYGLLVTELVGNAMKHAFGGGRQGVVRVELRAAPPGMRLRVCDNGSGLPEGFDLDQSSSMGLQLAASLAVQLGGTLRASGEGGAVFTAELSLLD